MDSLQLFIEVVNSFDVNLFFGIKELTGVLTCEVCKLKCANNLVLCLCFISAIMYVYKSTEAIHTFPLYFILLLKLGHTTNRVPLERVYWADKTWKEWLRGILISRVLFLRISFRTTARKLLIAHLENKNIFN